MILETHRIDLSTLNAALTFDQALAKLYTDHATLKDVPIVGAVSFTDKAGKQYVQVIFQKLP